MKRIGVFFVFLFMAAALCGTDLENSYIYLYSIDDHEQEGHDDYNGSAVDATYGDFEKAELGTVSMLSIGGKISAPEVYDQCILSYSIDGSKTVYNVSLPIYTGSQIGTNTIFESETGHDVDLSSLQAGTHSISVNFFVSSSDSKIVSLVDPASGGYSANFIIAEIPAPITLSDFTAEAVQGKVELNWVTESETENSHFLVYRDGEVIAQVQGNGTTTQQHEYSYLDPRVQDGNHEYILSDVSYSGVETKQAPVNVEIESEDISADFVLNKAYPNPFNPRVALSMEYGVGSNAVLNIYNSQGVLVDQLIKGFVEAGHHHVTWDATNMPSGVYIVKMLAGDPETSSGQVVTQSQKIVLMK